MIRVSLRMFISEAGDSVDVEQTHWILESTPPNYQSTHMTITAFLVPQIHTYTESVFTHTQTERFVFLPIWILLRISLQTPPMLSLHGSVHGKNIYAQLTILYCCSNKYMLHNFNAKNVFIYYNIKYIL